jgi:hypothetical protein
MFSYAISCCPLSTSSFSSTSPNPRFLTFLLSSFPFPPSPIPLHFSLSSIS